MTTSVLYFHGFASSPASAKIAALRPLIEPRGIVLETPDLNIPSFAKLDFDAIVEEGIRLARAKKTCALVGSSLGALVALAVAKDVALPMVLIAPALGVARRWSERIPDTDPVTVYNHALGADASIHKRFFEQMAKLDVDDAPPPSRVIALMGGKDETVPFEIVEETWQKWEQAGLAPGSKLIVFPEGDHGLVTEVAAIADAIAAVAR